MTTFIGPGLIRASDPGHAAAPAGDQTPEAGAPSARKVDASPFRSISTRGLDGAIRCVVTARRSKLMSEDG